MEQLKSRTKKTLIGILGGLVTLIGIVLIPYPGPGWLVVFSGLAILSTEFIFAANLLTYARGKYERWVQWLKRQPWTVGMLVLGFTGGVVLVTLWLLNVFGIFIIFFNLPYDWLISPFSSFKIK